MATKKHVRSSRHAHLPAPISKPSQSRTYQKSVSNTVNSSDVPLFLWLAFIVMVFIVLTQNTLLLTHNPVVVGHATATDSGFISICVNSPPTINVSGCNPLAFTTVNYTCFVNATDSAQTGLSYTVTKLSGPSAGDNLFNMSGPNLTFNPGNTQTGNYTLEFSVDDNAACGALVTTQDFNLTIKFFSDAPYLIKPIPNQTWDANTLRIAFNIDDYFADPNNSPLIYGYSNNSHVRIDFVGTQVLLTPALNWCGSETVYFSATNNKNLSATSNPVTLNVNCVSTQSQSNGGNNNQGQNSNKNGGKASGGGGGGFSSGSQGGGSNSQNQQCTPDYTCYDWSSCQLTRAIDPNTNNSETITITGVLGARTYEVSDEFKNNPDVFYQGFQYQECIDSTQCDQPISTVSVRPCVYHPSCSDNIQNEGETGVDCGGPLCPACGTCSDGLKDGQEEDVDCGGPFCKACNSCSDHRIDGKELGVDCGGPDCPACATCFDGIKNQDETGVDCGGKFCGACAQEQFPSATIPWLSIILLILIILVISTIFAAAIKRRFASLLLEWLLRYKRTNRRVLLPKSLKDEILRRLTELEAAVDSQPPLQTQAELARIIRDYFTKALGIDFEFTYEELVAAISNNHVDPILGQLMERFFTRVSYIEFSGEALSAFIVRTLIQETRELVIQTAVLTVDDLTQREQDIVIRPISMSAPSLERGYLMLSQVHLALEYGKMDMAAALYSIMLDWYTSAPVEEQQAIYEDFGRVYDEYQFAAKLMS